MSKMKYCRLDVGMLSDPGIRCLVRKHGMAGLGRYVALFLTVYNAEGAIDITDPDMRGMLSDALCMDDSDLDPFLGDLARWGLLDGEVLQRGHVISERMASEIELVRARCAAASKAGTASGKSRREGR